MAKIKVMQLIAPLSMAGAERVIQTLSCNIDSDRFEISVCSFLNHNRPSNSFTEIIERQGLCLHKIMLRRLFEWRPTQELVDLVRTNDIDILHAHGYRADMMGLIASKRLKIPIISTVHGWGRISNRWSRQETKARLYSVLDLFALRRFDRVVAVSKKTAELLQNDTRIDGELEIIPNIIDPSQYEMKNETARIREDLAIEKSAKVIGFLGRFSAEKGIEVLLDATPEILGKVPDAHLLLVGSGPLEDYLRERCFALDHRDRIHICREIADVRSFYESVDLLVLPSLTEGMPMVLLEAQYFGLPIVASKVGGIPEIVTHERNGFLVQPGDSAGLAKSIIRLLQDEDLALQIKNANQKKFTEENYIDSCISRYEDIYMDMMRGKGLEK